MPFDNRLGKIPRHKIHKPQQETLMNKTTLKKILIITAFIEG